MSACTENSQRLCKNDKCETCLYKSFAMSPRAKCWSNKNELSPRDVFISTAKKFLFVCDECSHEFVTSPNNLSRDRWCPYCGCRSLCDDEECLTCFDKSFASIDKAKYWSPQNTQSPRQTFAYSYKKYAFDCNCGHTF